MDYVLSKEYKRDLKKLPVEIQSGPEYAEVLYCLFNQKSLPERYKIMPYKEIGRDFEIATSKMISF